MNSEKYRRHFNQKNIVDSYSTNRHLYSAEIILLNRILNLPKPVKMLDIGIGGGRTTLYFHTLVDEYIGIDYSEAMIIACNNRFNSHFKKINFKTGDARNLSEFHDEFFNVVLFSFNGIDSLEHEDRIKALCEIKRVCKRGGVIFFSSHNLTTSDWVFKFHFSKHPKHLIQELMRWLRVRKNNKLPLKEIVKMNHTMINDGFIGEAKNYYINPTEQIKQLKLLGLKNLKIYSETTGNELTEETVLDSKDGWLYYECTH